MAQFEPYLCFRGTCAEALAFYEKTLGAKTEFSMTFGEMPPDPQMPPLDDASRKLIMHATIAIGDDKLMASDSPPGMPFEPMQGISISLAYDSAEEGRKVFEALSAGGTVKMPYGETFWAEGFGMAVDRFGTPWMVNAGGKDL